MSDAPPLSLNPPAVDLSTTYDVVIVGSGAAGGMAAYVLTQHGLNVALLEAGKRLNVEEELKSVEWPYEHPRHGDMPPGHHALTLDEYNFRQTPYGQGHAAKRLHSYPAPHHRGARCEVHENAVARLRVVVSAASREYTAVAIVRWLLCIWRTAIEAPPRVNQPPDGEAQSATGRNRQ